MSRSQCPDCHGTGYIRIGLRQLACERCSTRGHIEDPQIPIGTDLEDLCQNKSVPKEDQVVEHSTINYDDMVPLELKS